MEFIELAGDGRTRRSDPLLSALGSGPALVEGHRSIPYEPLFALAAAHGFGRIDANLAAPTTSHAAGLLDHAPLELDALLVRALGAWWAAVTPTFGLSDHQVVSAAVRLAQP